MLWWTEELRTGIDYIDKQHKSIFDKANEIFNLGIESETKDVEKTFKFLINYSNDHFHEEEEYMIELKYNDFIEHRNQHNYFVESIYKIYENIMINGLSMENINNLQVLIIEWLANHISVYDKKFIKSIRDK